MIFSVVLPTYNRVDTISRAIESVLSQTFTHFELLIIDDGSTDNSKECIETYQTDSRCVYRQQQHQGVSAARNHGIHLAKGKYIAFLDSDDQWTADKLQQQYDFFTNSIYDVLQTCEQWIRNGKQVQARKVHIKKQGYLFAHSLQRCTITPSSVAVKKELFRKIGYFDTMLPACEDYDLWLRISRCYPIGLVKKNCLVRYAGHGDQLSQRYPAMDRYRVFAIQKLLHSRDISQRQQQLAQYMLSKKAAILLNGAKKRSLAEIHVQQLATLARGEWQRVTLAQSSQLLLSEQYWL